MRFRTWLVAGLLAGATLVASGAELLDRVLVTVNDDVILQSELEQAVQNAVLQLRERNAPLPPTEALARQVLERLIQRRLQVQKAAQLGIKVEDDAVNSALRGIAQNNRVSLEQMREILARDGVDFTAFRDNLREELILGKLQKQQVERVQVTPQEIDGYLASRPELLSSQQEYRLQHILISVPEGATPEALRAAQTKADTALQQLRGGQEFATVAAGVSEGQQALEGGDLGFRALNQLPSLFVDEVKTMQAGELRGPLRNASGLHLIRLAEVRQAGQTTVNQTRVRHILLGTEKQSAAEAQRKLAQARQALGSGADFAQLARQLSEDQGSASRGGELGWVSPGELVPEFERAMDALAVNGLSEPVQTPFGWHLIQVLERRTQANDGEARKTRARAELRKRKAEEELELWQRRLREEAYIEIHSAS